MSPSPRLWLCGITSAGNAANLRSMVEPILPYVAGLQFTFHYPTDEGATYLEGVKGAGRVVYAHYSGRHGASMTQYLHQGTMQEGDHFIQLDSTERLSVAFCRQTLPRLLDSMRAQNLAMVANYGKGLLFRFNEQLEFRGTPHWTAVGLDGGAANVELSTDLFWNERNAQRDEYQWVGHYARYMLMVAGSNHAALGLDHHPLAPGQVPNDLFAARDAKRLAFRQAMRARGFPLTLEGLTAFMSQPLDDTLKALINSDKVWSDWYHYTLKGDRTVVHSHKPSDAKVVS